MSNTFVDTSFLIALVCRKDELHERAMGWHQCLEGRLLTTEYVLLELVDSLSFPPFRQAATNAVRVLRRRAAVRVVASSTALMDEGLAFFSKHADKRWSLTDCISFVVMRRESVSEALSNDHPFEQAGFRALLRAEPPEK